MTTNSNPFIEHRTMLLNANYGAAISLQALTLTLYNSRHAKWDASRVSNMDDAHFKIAIDMLAHYRRFRENDEAFLDIGRRLAEQCESSSDSLVCKS